MLCNFRMFDCETSVWSFLWFETEIICVTKHGQHKALLFDLMIFVNSNKRIEHLIFRTIARERSLTHKHSCTQADTHIRDVRFADLRSILDVSIFSFHNWMKFFKIQITFHCAFFCRLFQCVINELNIGWNLLIKLNHL